MASDIFKQIGIKVEVDSSPLSNLGKEVKQVGAEFQSPQTRARMLREESQRLGSEGSKAFRGLGKSLKDLGRSVTGIEGDIKGAAAEFKRLTVSGLAMQGIQGAVNSAKRAIAETVRTGARFETSLSKIEGLVGVNARQVAEWGDELKRIGPETGKSVNELAEALFFVSSAGFRGKEAIDVLTASAKASASGLGETKTIADLVTSAVNAYGSDVLDAGQATDILVAAVRAGKAEASEFAGSIGSVLPIASQLGVSFDQASAAIAAMTKTGSSASEASTQLSAILNTMISPAEGSSDALKEMGLSFGEIRKTIREDGLLKALSDINELTQRYGEETVGKVFPNIRALRGQLDLLGANTKDTAEVFRDVANASGATEEAFEAQRRTAKFLYDQFKTELEVVMVGLAEVVLPPLNVMVKTLTGSLRILRDIAVAVTKPLTYLFDQIGDRGEKKRLSVLNADEASEELEGLIAKLTELKSRQNELASSGGVNFNSIVSVKGEIDKVEKNLSLVREHLYNLNATDLDKARRELSSLREEMDKIRSGEIDLGGVRGLAGVKLQGLQKRFDELIKTVANLEHAELAEAEATEKQSIAKKKVTEEIVGLGDKAKEQIATLESQIATFGKTEEELIEYARKQSLAGGASKELADEVARLRLKLLELREGKKVAEEAAEELEKLGSSIEGIRRANNQSLLPKSQQLRRELGRELKLIEQYGKKKGLSEKVVARDIANTKKRYLRQITKAEREEYAQRLKNSESFFDNVKAGWLEFVGQVESNGQLISSFFTETMNQMRSSFSDLFYNVLVGKFDNLKDIAKNTFQSILRMASDTFSRTLFNGVVNYLGRPAASGRSFLGSLSGIVSKIIPSSATAAGGRVSGVEVSRAGMASQNIPSSVSGGVSLLDGSRLGGGLAVSELTGVGLPGLVAKIPGFGVGQIFGAPAPQLPGVASLTGQATKSGFLGGALNTGTANLLGGVGALFTIGSSFLAGDIAGGIGASAGAGVGAAVGSLIPGLGTLVGAGIGSFIGKIFGGLFRKKPKLDIDFSGIVGGDALNVADILEDDFGKFISKSSRKTGLGTGEVRRYISDAVKPVAEHIQKTIDSLPTQTRDVLDDLFRTTPLNAGKLNFYKKGKKVGKAFEKYLSGGVQTQFLESISDFFSVAYERLGIMRSRADEIIGDRISQLKSASDKPAAVQKALQEFQEITTLAASVDAPRDPVSAQVRELEKLSLRGGISLKSLNDEVKRLVKTFDDPEAIKRVAQLRNTLVALQKGLANVVTGLISSTDSLNQTIESLGGTSVDTTKYVKSAIQRVRSALNQEGLSAADKQSLLGELGKLAAMQLHREQEVLQSRLAGLQQELEAAHQIERIAWDANQALENLVMGPDSLLSDRKKLEVIEGRIGETTDPAKLTQLYQQLFATAKSVFSPGSSELQSIFAQARVGLESIAALKPQRDIETIQSHIENIGHNTSAGIRELYEYMRDEGIKLLDMRLNELKRVTSDTQDAILVEQTRQTQLLEGIEAGIGTLIGTLIGNSLDQSELSFSDRVKISRFIQGSYVRQ